MSSPPALPSDQCLLYLVRHGATDNNLANPPLLQGCRIDPQLSADGIDQARQAARALFQQQINHVVASPLQRAQQTASLIALTCGLKVQTEPAFREVDVGAWEQRSWAEIAQTEPEAYRHFLDDPGSHGYREGENFQQVLDRVLPALLRLLQANLGSRVVVVGHNIVNRVLIAHAMELSFRQARSIHLDNGGISVMHFQASRLRLLTLNSALHLTQG